MKNLPSIDKVVEATVRYTRNWPECLGGLKITDKKMMVKRIKTGDNSQQWQWSGAEMDTFINGKTVDWNYLNT